MMHETMKCPNGWPKVPSGQLARCMECGGFSRFTVMGTPPAPIKHTPGCPRRDR